MIKFLINTRPKPQQRHRSSGRNFHYDPSAKDKKEFILQAKQYAPKIPTLKNIEIEFIFCYKRPKNHYRTGKYADQIKEKWITLSHTKKPDIDNLVKFVLDSLSGTFFDDDKQVVIMHTTKAYDFYEDLTLIKINKLMHFLVPLACHLFSQYLYQNLILWLMVV